MTDLDPEIWNNPTLGRAANNENLDRLERQQIEDRSARLEDREPNVVVVENDYPGWRPDVMERTGTVPSNYMAVHFEGDDPLQVITSGEGVKPEGMSDEEWNAQQADSEEAPAESSETVETEESSVFAGNEIPPDPETNTYLDSSEENVNRDDRTA
ncbi:hypothetical protein [Streptomyces sp. NPDC048720]|uniref:hypothetical protein n=1 Tax=Streptomyces sp. NPDC048720 TaxID=3365588 RepID=UPI003719EC89